MAKKKYPQTLYEAFEWLVAACASEADLEKFRKSKQDDLAMFHFSLGMYIRNEFGLWEGNDELVKDIYGDNFLFRQPDEISGEILGRFWDAAQKKDTFDGKQQGHLIVMRRYLFISEISEAIRLRRLLTFTYGEGERTVEPYVVGKNEAGNILLRAFQVAADGDVPTRYGWKMFSLAKMSNVKMTGNRWFGEREGYNPYDPDIYEPYADIRLTCPMCGKWDMVLAIQYGYPGPELMEAAEKGKIMLGGCCVSDDDPSFYCKRCEISFYKDGRIFKPEKDAWKDY